MTAFLWTMFILQVLGVVLSNSTFERIVNLGLAAWAAALIFRLL